jgi:hypothetical protein
MIPTIMGITIVPTVVFVTGGDEDEDDEDEDDEDEEDEGLVEVEDVEAG